MSKYLRVSGAGKAAPVSMGRAVYLIQVRGTGSGEADDDDDEIPGSRRSPRCPAPCPLLCLILHTATCGMEGVGWHVPLLGDCGSPDGFPDNCRPVTVPVSGYKMHTPLHAALSQTATITEEFPHEGSTSQHKMAQSYTTHDTRSLVSRPPVHEVKAPHTVSWLSNFPGWVPGTLHFLTTYLLS